MCCVFPIIVKNTSYNATPLQIMNLSHILNSMKNIVWTCVLLISSIFSVPFAYSEVNEGMLLQKANQATQLPGVKRFNYMRFFVATNTVPQKPGFWESLFSSNTQETHQRALAIYLFNMHVSTQLYQQTPKILTLNYLGVLDAIVRGPNRFDAQHATEFYQKNQVQIDNLLQQFRQKAPRNWPAPTQKQITAWLALLEKQPRQAGKPVYLFPAQNLLKGSLAATTSARLEAAATAAQKQAHKQIVAYDVADVQLADYDSKIGNNQSHRKRTYRWVKDECYYTTYLMGRQLITQIAQRRLPWDTRIYTLTATAKKGDFLTPAKGDRFELANGQKGLHWRYHTALLIVVHQNNAYVPVVLDAFLGGTKPISLERWASYFSSNTLFSAVPFSRDSDTENALKVPQKIDEKSIWADGNRYEPAPVEK